MLSYPLRLLTTNRTLRDIPGRERSGPHVLGVPVDVWGVGSLQRAVSTVRRPATHLASGPVNVFMGGEDSMCFTKVSNDLAASCSSDLLSSVSLCHGSLWWSEESPDIQTSLPTVLWQRAEVCPQAELWMYTVLWNMDYFWSFFWIDWNKKMRSLNQWLCIIRHHVTVS